MKLLGVPAQRIVVCAIADSSTTGCLHDAHVIWPKLLFASQSRPSRVIGDWNAVASTQDNFHRTAEKGSKTSGQKLLDVS